MEGVARYRRAAVNKALLRFADRIGRATQYLPVAQGVGVPLTRLKDRSYRAALMAVPWTLIPPGIRRDLRLVCDVGANRGDFSKAMLMLAPRARIIALEPNPAEFATLEQRFAGEQRISLLHSAAGARAETATLHVESQSALSSLRLLSDRARTFHGVPATPVSTHEVPVMPLDSVLAGEPEISLLKIDVQGFENQVLDGARQTLQRSKCLVIEVNYEPNYYGGASGFRELYNRIETESPLRLSCVSAPGLAPDGFGAWADAVFVHESLWPKSSGSRG